MYKLQLGGGMAKYTGRINGVRFVDGVYSFGNMTRQEIQSYEGLVKYFTVGYQARLINELEPATSAPAPQTGEVPPATDVVEVAEHPVEVEVVPSEIAFAEMTPRQQSIYGAVIGLDPLNEEHWTMTGLPRVDAVEEALNDPSVTRDEIKAVLPEYLRPTQ